MRSFCQLALLALPLLARVSGQEAEHAPAKDTESTHKLYDSPSEAFQELLNALPEESLHVAMNSLQHFRNGIFESDRHGVERVHRENPPLATKLIVAAVNDLKKRQLPSNGTQPTSQAPPTQQSTTDGQAPDQSTGQAPGQTTQNQNPEQSTQAAPPRSSAVIIPVPVATTDAQGRPTTTTNRVLAPNTATVAVAQTTTNAQGQAITTTQNRPAVVLSGTDSRGQAFTTTSAVDFAPTAGQVLTTTNAGGSTILTTYTPDGGKVSSLKLVTSTGKDGKPTVVTSYTFVDPAAATDTGAQPSGTSQGKPGLQNQGAAVDAKKNAWAVLLLGAALGGALAFFA